MGGSVVGEMDDLQKFAWKMASGFVLTKSETHLIPLHKGYSQQPEVKVPATFSACLATADKNGNQVQMTVHVPLGWQL